MTITNVNTERMWISRLTKDAAKYGFLCADDLAAVQWGLAMSDSDLLSIRHFGPKGVRWIRGLSIERPVIDALRPEAA